MTDTQTEPPFDPDAATRIQGFLDAIAASGRTRSPGEPAAVAGFPWDGGYHELTEADLREVLRQLAYTRDENQLLAKKCAAWRGQYEEVRGQLEAAPQRPNRAMSATGPEIAVVGTPLGNDRPVRHTLRQVGWLGQTGALYSLDEDPRPTEPGSYAPLYFIAHSDYVPDDDPEGCA